MIAHGGNEHPTAVADLQGKRLVVAEETDESGRLNESRVKILTGGDRIAARRMRQDYFEFDPSHQFIIATNHKPRVQGSDFGIWRRLKLIPFQRQFTGEQCDTDLPAKLEAELPGILAWCAAGIVAMATQPLRNEPNVVKAATAEYRTSQDVIGQFIADCCVEDRTLSAKTSELYSKYVSWCEESGERTRSQREFGTRMAERGFEPYRNGTARGWRGIGLVRG